MTRLPIYQVDAFTDRLFAGNPAAVVPLEDWLPEATMQAIAAENNLPATAFFRREGEGYAIRWFTPAAELPLCGHGTLGSAYVILNRLEPAAPRAEFRTKSGALLVVAREGDALAMTLPSDPAKPFPAPAGLAEALGATPRATFAAQRILAVFDDAATVIRLAPDFAALRRLGAASSSRHRETAHMTASRASSFRHPASTKTPSPARPTARSCPIGRSASERPG